MQIIAYRKDGMIGAVSCHPYQTGGVRFWVCVTDMCAFDSSDTRESGPMECLPAEYEVLMRDGVELASFIGTTVKASHLLDALACIEAAVGNLLNNGGR